MGTEKNNKTEYVYEESVHDEDDYNRKNVDSIKRIIVLLCVIVFALPILFCFYLMIRMNSIERKLEILTEQFSLNEQRKEAAALATEQAEDLLDLEQAAYDDLEKSAVTKTQKLTDDGGNNNSEIADEESEQVSAQEVPLNGRKVYLTFDDGPSTYTDDILDILEEKNVKATFFVVYNSDESIWPAYKRIVDDGHTLAMHSYTHVYETVYASLDSFEEDVTNIHDFLYEQTGVDCKFYRFPGGSSNTVSNVSVKDMAEYLYEEGITYFDWNALSGDAVNVYLSADQLNDTIMGYVRNNQEDSVVLMHDLQDVHTTVDALPDLIDTLKSEGYEICAIDENTMPVQHVRFQGADE